MELFIIFKVAVYRHECGGIYSSLDAAKSAALELLQREDDNHHFFEIVPFTLDVIPKTVKRQYESHTGIVEAEPVFSTHK